MIRTCLKNNCEPVSRDFREAIAHLPVSYEINVDHQKATNAAIDALKKEQWDALKECILRAATVRNFLG